MKQPKLYLFLVLSLLKLNSLKAFVRVDDSTNNFETLLILDDDLIPYQPIVDLPIHLKSNRIINFQSTTVLPKGSLEVSIQHRFGKISGGMDQLWGIDNLNSMRIGVDYGVTKDFTLGAGRSSLNKTYNSYLKYRLIGKNSANFQMTYLFDMMIDGRSTNDWGLTPFYFTHRLNYTHTLSASIKITDQVFIGVSPTVVHFNLVDGINDENDIFVAAAYIRAKLLRKLFLTAESSKIVPISENVPQNINPSFGLGIEYYTPKHVFQISFSNTRSLNEPYVMASDQPASGLSNFCLGFNIIRRW